MTPEQYDFTRPPEMPKEVRTTLYYFPHQQKSSLGLQPTGPAFRELQCMAAHYDVSNNLLFTRFIFKDGTWRDET